MNDNTDYYLDNKIDKDRVCKICKLQFNEASLIFYSKHYALCKICDSELSETEKLIIKNNLGGD